MKKPRNYFSAAGPIILGLCLLLAFQSFGQSDSTKTEKKTSKKESEEITYLKKTAIGVHAGLPGFGFEVAQNLSPHFNLRFRASYFTIGDLIFEYDLDGRNLDLDLDAQTQTYDLLVEFLPSTKSSFKLVAGISYIADLRGDANIMLSEGSAFGDIFLEPEEIGEINLSLFSEGVAPYMGFGFGRAVPKGRVGFGFEAGTYYVQSPTVEMDASGLLTPTANETEEQKLENALDSFRWMPVVLLKLTVKLN